MFSKFFWVGAMSEEKAFRGYALVIDDNRTDAMLLETSLLSLGCCVDTASDTNINEQLDNSYDIIFVDINMPTINGFTLSDDIRRSTQPNRNIPIIAVSGDPYSEDQKDHCMDIGMDGYLEKPADLDLLADVLTEYLPQRPETIQKFSRDGGLRLKGFMRKRKDK